MKWITNVRDAIEIPATPTSCKCYRGDSLCVTCNKEMPYCWNTVCSRCGDTSCYAHSTVLNGRWLCAKCAPTEKELRGEAQQTFTHG